MLTNIILLILVVIAYLTAQIILTVTSIQDGYTFKEVVNYSQDKKVGKIFMTIFYLPARFIMYLYSLLPINTTSCFDEDFEEEFKEVK